MDHVRPPKVSYLKLDSSISDPIKKNAFESENYRTIVVQNCQSSCSGLLSQFSKN